MNTPANPGRRGLLRSACRHCIGISAMLGLPALAQDRPADAVKLPPRFARPQLDSDEGGLWGLMDREEARIRRSPLAIRDEKLKSYLGDLTCRMTDGHCPDIRVHVVRMPAFNAAMAPNGMMLVWSGLLLRVENEAQLAAVIGHELGHYLERHQVEQLRAAKDRAVLAQMIGLIGGLGGAIGRLGVLATLFAFSREHEERADRLGMRLMQQAGYDGRQAAQVWDDLLAEIKVTGGKEAGERSAMFATHPPAAWRREALLKLAGERSGVTNSQPLREVIAPQRFGWIEDEIKRGQYEESLVLFDRLLKRDPDDVQVRYARGEVYRLRDEQQDGDRALDDLMQASRVLKAPPETFRALGLLHRSRSDAVAASQAFEKYLVLAPEAPDAGMIKSYLGQVKP